MTQPRGVLPALTSLRFPAALLVFTWHCEPTRRISTTFSFGYLGVAFFFLLSGFILTYTYHGQFRDGLRAPSLRAFYAARIARLYPLHLATMPLMLAVVVYLGTDRTWNSADVPTRLGAVAAQLALVQSWIPIRAVYFGVNAPAWSISVELFLYSSFPLVIFGLLRLFRSSPSYVVLLSAAALWAAQIALLWTRQVAVDDWRWYVFPPSRLIDFVVGMLLAIAFVRSGSETSLRLRPTSLEIIAVTLVCFAVYASPLVPVAVRFSAWTMPPLCAVIFLFAQGRGAISRLLAHPLFVVLGDVSFAFYLSHLAVADVIGHVFGRDHPLVVPLAFACTLTLSFALYHGVEQPMRRCVRTLLMPNAGRARAIATRTAAAEA